MTASPTGGTFSGPGVSGSTFNPATAGVGSHTITYSGTNACGPFSTTRTVTVTAGPTASITPVASPCVTDPVITLNATPTGGTFSGPGVSGNQFNPATAGAGTKTITYAGTQNGCAYSVTTQITVSTCNPQQTNTCNIPLIEQTFASAGYPKLNVQGQDCSLYFYNSANQSADQARAAAQNLGTTLVSIQSQAENDALQQALNAAGFSNAVVWIGGGFTGAPHGPNDFTWNDGTPVVYTNWNPGEPNNSSGVPGTPEN